MAQTALPDRTLAMFLLVAVAVMFEGAQGAARPLTDPVMTATSSEQLISKICSSGRVMCATTNGDAASVTANGLRDASIVTINDLQEDFFLESVLIEGNEVALRHGLRDPVPRRAFLSSAAADELPPLTTSTALNVMTHFGVATDSPMATAVATAAHLCGSVALPGEERRCAASADAVAAFVTAELGQHVTAVNVYTSTTTSRSGQSTTATLSNIAKGSLAEGKSIVVCHHIDFPSILYYCHRVTGTRVVKATLTPNQTGDAAPIQAVGICHINTALWLSRHPAFAALKIARGEEACHWLVENDLVFTPSTTAPSQITVA